MNCGSPFVDNCRKLTFLKHMQTPESKKEEYKKYLERTGVTDAITKGQLRFFSVRLQLFVDSVAENKLIFPSVLVALYEEPERPVNAIEYINMRLGVVGRTNSDFEALQARNEELQKRVRELEAQVHDLNAHMRTPSAI